MFIQFLFTDITVMSVAQVHTLNYILCEGKKSGEEWGDKKTPHAVHEKYSLNSLKAGNSFS